MKYLLGALCLVIGIYVLLLIMSRRPYQRKNLTLDDVRSYLQALLKRGYNGGYIIVEDMKSQKFVQLAKYIKGKGEIGIELSFPKAPWSLIHYEAVKHFLRSNNIAFAIQPVNSEPVTEFIDVDCHTDLDLAFKLVEGIFINIFGMSRDTRFKVTPVNISVRDELIDTP